MLQPSDSIRQGRHALITYVTAMLLLGTLGIFIKEARLSSAAIVFFRCLFGAMALATHCAWKGLFRRGNFPLRGVLLAIVSGTLMVVNWVAFSESVQRIGISVATVVFHVQPFLLVLIGALALGEKLSDDKLVWLGVGFGGLLLATGLGMDSLLGSPASGSGYALGVACTLAAALAYAGVALVTKSIKGMPPTLIALIHCLTGVILLPIWIDWPALAITRTQWPWLVGMGVIHTALVYALVYAALPKLRNASIAVLTFIYPAAAVGFDFLFYGHALQVLQLAGLVLILLAGAGVNLNWRWNVRNNSLVAKVRSKTA